MPTLTRRRAGRRRTQRGRLGLDLEREAGRAPAQEDRGRRRRAVRWRANGRRDRRDIHRGE
jgi:hypothetical protein